jgi:hypothetical protein
MGEGWGGVYGSKRTSHENGGGGGERGFIMLHSLPMEEGKHHKSEWDDFWGPLTLREIRELSVINY